MTFPNHAEDGEFQVEIGDPANDQATAAHTDNLNWLLNKLRELKQSEVDSGRMPDKVAMISLTTVNLQANTKLSRNTAAAMLAVACFRILQYEDRYGPLVEYGPVV